jgi:hypothetical protein
MALLTATRIALSAATAATLLSIASAAIAEPVLVVHPSCPVSRLSADDARKLMLGQDLSWSNGEPTQLVELRMDDAALSAAYLAIARKTPSQLRAEWNRLIFAGRTNPPLRFGTVDEVRAAVARTPGAFAVIDSASTDATVKIVFRISGKG